MVRLSEVAYIEMGQSPPSSVVFESSESGVAFLQGNAEFTDRYPRARQHCTKPPKIAEAADALISVRAPVGAINKADQRYCIGRGLAAVRFTGVDPAFGFHALSFYSRSLRRVAQGTTFEAIGGADLREMDFPLCSRPEQRGIAAILDTLDEVIRKTEDLIAKLRQIERGLLDDLLTRGVDECGDLRPWPEDAPDLYKESPLGRVPRQWAIGPFSAYASPRRPFLKTGPFGTSLKGEHWVDSGIPVITIGALGEGSFTHSELLHVSERTAKSLSAYVVEEGDIVFSRVADVGRSVVVSARESGWIMSSNLMWISLDSAKVRPHYVWLSLSANSIVRTQVRRSVNAGGRDVANGAVLRSLVLAWPEPLEQERIVEAAHALAARVRSEENELSKLRAISRGLADDLLSGRVRVNVPEESTQ